MVDLFFLAEAHSEGGFGLNLDILGTNLINLTILVGILVYYGKDLISNLMRDRNSKIAEQIQEAEKKQQTAAAALQEQQQKLAEAEKTAVKIRQDALANAERTKQAILAQGEKEIERLRATAVADLNSEQAKVIAELRQRVAALAIERVETQLPEILNDEAQNQLIESSIARLGG
ncbi:MAG: F0F1 ATP synthase subunit B [Xenococcus sp. MO_188.B8]|nr:F0F1 ATP synthase subunit B [Xenococcus sp. MO_188.B8]